MRRFGRKYVSNEAPSQSYRTRALLRLERTMNLLCHLEEGGGEGGREERGGREGGVSEGGRRGVRDDCYMSTYSNRCVQ